ncbi:holin [Dorea longicatena]|uniref:holin n=1 Tax=Dorea longicatena TaxID=88431 RepID=UPI003029CA0B|nr:holin [Dorea longicatena]
MFKNCVFKVSVDTKKWMKKAGIRAIKTVAQTAVATIGTATALGQVDAKLVISASILSGILSLLTSIAGLPECNAEDE